MVQVTIRVRPKNGYTYTQKIKTVTMESSTRLEELLQRHAPGESSSSRASSSSASPHAALYLNGRELPLNSSIASHNLDDGVIIECCKSPNMSAAISAVLRDLDRIGKTIPVGSRSKASLKGFIEVPDHYLIDDDSIDTGTFWKTEKWSNDSLKNRKICLATMKMILQRDGRYSGHDVPFCTDCDSLHQNVKEVMPERSGYLFSPLTKRDGKPTTAWVLLHQKLIRQNEIAASFQVGQGAGLDALEEFIRLDTLRHPNTEGSPARRKRRRTQPQTPDVGNSATRTTNPNLNSNGTPNIGAPTARKRKSYCPEYASGPFAVLCTLIEAMEGNHHNANGMRQLSLTGDSLKYLAQKRCRSNFYDRQISVGSRSAFACMEGLAGKNLVRKEITMDNIEKWQLLPDGEAMANECLKFEKAALSSFPSIKFPGERLGSSNANDNIVLIVDKREDAHFRKRLATLCADDNVPTEEKELPAGDYLFLQENNVLPIIIERKTWSDLADSVCSKGRAYGRLDCVKIGSTSSRCEKGRCQLCRMSRSGCQQIFFIIEGSRCRGRDARRERDVKCSAQKRCQSCKALNDRHKVTQEELEKVLHKLQTVHGCFIIYTRSYNETIFTLFAMRKMLNGEYFANQMRNSNASTANGDDDFARAIALSLGDSAPSILNDMLSYEQFCTNTRTSENPRLDLREKNKDILNWQSKDLANIVKFGGDRWEQSVAKHLFEVTTSKTSEDTSSLREDIRTTKRQRIEEKDASSNENIINLVNLEDSDEEVCILDNSQDSIQILSPVHKSKNASNTIFEEVITVEEYTCNTSAHTEVISLDADLKQSTLLILNGWDDYDDKFNADLNRVWQDSYHGRSSDHHSTSKYKLEIKNLLEQHDSPPFSYLQRKDFITVLLWMAVKYGINLRSVPPRAAVSSELQQLWTSTNISGRSQLSVNSSSCSIDNKNPLVDFAHASARKPPPEKSVISSRSTIAANQRQSISIGRSAASAGQKTPSKETITPSSAIIATNQRQTAKTARKLPPRPSSAASKAIEARLRRFGGISSNLTQTQRRETTTLTSKTDLVQNVHYSGNNISLVPASNKWKCEVCSYDNNNFLRECEMCENKRPAASTSIKHESPAATQHVHHIDNEMTPVSNSNKWECKNCTYDNDNVHRACKMCGGQRYGSSTFMKRESPAAAQHVDNKMPPVSNMKTWKCKECTYQNDNIHRACEVCGREQHAANISIKCDSSAVAQHGVERFSSPGFAKKPIAPILLSSAKKQPTCGACGLTGHNRGNATEHNCPSYNDETEINLREQKKRKAREKAVAKEQAYEESKRADETLQQRTVEFEKQMEAMKDQLENSTKLQKEDAERKRKQAESARRRANKYG